MGRRGPRRIDSRGLSLLETLIATVIVSLLAAGMASFFAGGRASILEDGHKRMAVELAQGELERLELLPVAQITPDVQNVVFDNRTYQRTTAVTLDSPAAGMRAVVVTVSWTTLRGKPRSLQVEASYGPQH